MEKPAADPKTRIGRMRARCTVTANDAYQRLLASPGTWSLTALQRQLTAEGHRVSLTTLQQWSAKHNWRGLLSQQVHKADTGDLARIATSICARARHLTSDFVQGIEVQVLERLHQSIPMVTIADPKNILDMVEVLERLAPIKHALRGVEIGRATGTGKPGPVISLSGYGAARTKLHGNGAGTNPGTNGHG